ncbi:hypothetical protein HU200_003996 [Digitaria exilis]|uniref:glutaredoxin-dependent peroxiredoxin n=1 Tax=Digitaria exilis TaxID=1010633 RepID=A0A835FWZ0_9POAL|nr:hypothetical protein HU200_003996 [Digitaria exilis]
MGIMDVAEGKPEQCTSEQGSAFEVKDNLFRGCILGVIAPHLINPLLKKKTGKEMWDALDAQYGVSDAGSELYLMEQFLDYRMVEDRPVVEQANELHVLAKDLGCCNKENPCVLPDKFVAGGIISKLPPSWRDFATSLKHRRQEFTIDGLIGTLDVEEKARAKDVRNKGTPVGASANFVQKNINARTNNKGKGKKPPQPQNPGKTKQTAGFKKKKGACYVCGSEDHFAGKCPQRKEGKDLPVLVMETEDAFLESITSPPSSAVNLPPHRRRCAHTTGESRFLGSVSTRLLAQNCYVFTGVRFTVLGTPPPSNDYTAPRLLPARLRRSDCTASTDLPASNLYDYFEQGQSRNIMSTDDIPPAGNGATNAFGREGYCPPPCYRGHVSMVNVSKACEDRSHYGELPSWASIKRPSRSPVTYRLYPANHRIKLQFLRAPPARFTDRGRFAKIIAHPQIPSHKYTRRGRRSPPAPLPCPQSRPHSLHYLPSLSPSASPATSPISGTAMAPIAVGDSLPDGQLGWFDENDQLQQVSVHALAAGKKVILFGVPGAFTPTCRSQPTSPSHFLGDPLAFWLYMWLRFGGNGTGTGVSVVSFGGKSF